MGFSQTPSGGQATGSVVPFDNPGDYARVLRRVQRLWDEGTVVFTDHSVLDY